MAFRKVEYTLTDEDRAAQAAQAAKFEDELSKRYAEVHSGQHPFMKTMADLILSLESAVGQPKTPADWMHFHHLLSVSIISATWRTANAEADKLRDQLPLED